MTGQGRAFGPRGPLPPHPTEPRRLKVASLYQVRWPAGQGWREPRDIGRLRGNWSYPTTVKFGAGRIKVSQIDGYPVEVDGSHHTIVMVAEDVKGSIARIAGLLSDDGVNIATLRLSRKYRGGDAFMVIEVDEPPAEKVGADLRALPWVRWTHRIDKVGG